MSLIIGRFRNLESFIKAFTESQEDEVVEKTQEVVTEETHGETEAEPEGELESNRSKKKPPRNLKVK